MPGLNQRGPSGRGPMTGGGRGLCNTGRPVFETKVAGKAGFGRGMGSGRGFRCRFGRGMRGYPGWGCGRNRSVGLQAYAQEAYQEIDALRVQAESMQHTLDAINKHISELEKSE